MNVANMFRTLTMAGMVFALLFGSIASAKRRPDHPYRYSVVGVPVSLAIGTVRTPEFAPRALVLDHDPGSGTSPVPATALHDGAIAGRLESEDCTGNDPLLRADWTVWNEGQIVSSGSSKSQGGAKFTNDYMFKFLGSFPTLPGKKYAVEVKFTKDGTPLNVANPHLIVTGVGDE